LVPVSQLAEIADKFTRNEIMTSNELRQIVGMKPSEDPGADELRNKMLYDEGNGQVTEAEDPESSSMPEDLTDLPADYSKRKKNQNE
jgi:hypothetical protein